MIYLYMQSKNPQISDSLWTKIKSEYYRKAKELLSSLDSYIDASGIKNRGERIQTSILMLRSLEHLLAASEGKKMPTALKKDVNGKPCFEGEKLFVSISHSASDIVICYSFDREIGVDIEDEINEERAGKLGKRFPKIDRLTWNNNGETDEKICAFELSFDEFALADLPLASIEFTAKWTAAEAVMKCGGGGFSALPELDVAAAESKVLSFEKASENTKTYISVAIKR